eukprot:Platyproteum_vivax@DN7119_c0_g2_i1.p1
MKLKLELEKAGDDETLRAQLKQEHADRLAEMQAENASRLEAAIANFEFQSGERLNRLSELAQKRKLVEIEMAQGEQDWTLKRIEMQFNHGFQKQEIEAGSCERLALMQMDHNLKIDTLNSEFEYKLAKKELELDIEEKLARANNDIVQIAAIASERDAVRMQIQSEKAEAIRQAESDLRNKREANDVRRSMELEQLASRQEQERQEFAAQEAAALSKLRNDLVEVVKVVLADSSEIAEERENEKIDRDANSRLKELQHRVIESKVQMEKDEYAQLMKQIDGATTEEEAARLREALDLRVERLADLFDADYEEQKRSLELKQKDIKEARKRKAAAKLKEQEAMIDLRNKQAEDMTTASAEQHENDVKEKLANHNEWLHVQMDEANNLMAREQEKDSAVRQGILLQLQSTDDLDAQKALLIANWNTACIQQQEETKRHYLEQQAQIKDRLANRRAGRGAKKDQNLLLEQKHERQALRQELQKQRPSINVMEPTLVGAPTSVGIIEAKRQEVNAQLARLQVEAQHKLELDEMLKKHNDAADSLKKEMELEAESLRKQLEETAKASLKEKEKERMQMEANYRMQQQMAKTDEEREILLAEYTKNLQIVDDQIALDRDKQDALVQQKMAQRKARQTAKRRELEEQQLEQQNIAKLSIDREILQVQGCIGLDLKPEIEGDDVNASAQSLWSNLNARHESEMLARKDFQHRERVSNLKTSANRLDAELEAKVAEHMTQFDKKLTAATSAEQLAEVVAEQERAANEVRESTQEKNKRHIDIITKSIQNQHEEEIMSMKKTQLKQLQDAMENLAQDGSSFAKEKMLSIKRDLMKLEELKRIRDDEIEQYKVQVEQQLLDEAEDAKALIIKQKKLLQDQGAETKKEAEDALRKKMQKMKQDAESERKKQALDAGNMFASNIMADHQKSLQELQASLQKERARQYYQIVVKAIEKKKGNRGAKTLNELEKRSAAIDNDKNKKLEEEKEAIEKAKAIKAAAAKPKAAKMEMDSDDSSVSDDSDSSSGEEMVPVNFSRPIRVVDKQKEEAERRQKEKDEKERKEQEKKEKEENDRIEQQD